MAAAVDAAGTMISAGRKGAGCDEWRGEGGEGDENEAGDGEDDESPHPVPAYGGGVEDADDEGGGPTPERTLATERALAQAIRRALRASPATQAARPEDRGRAV